MVAARRVTHMRFLLTSIIDNVWYLGERVHYWLDGLYIRRVPVAPPGNIFWGQEFVRKELAEAERRYPFEGLLEGAYFSYVCTLIPQLINVVASDFVPSAPPP